MTSSLEKYLPHIREALSAARGCLRDPTQIENYVPAMKLAIHILSENENKASSPEKREEMKLAKYLLEGVMKFAQEKQNEKSSKTHEKYRRALSLTALILIPLGLLSLFSFSSPRGFFVLSTSSSSIFFIILAVIGVVALVYKLLH